MVLIHAPISRQAIDEMRIWARGGGSTSTQQNARTSFMSNSVDGGSYIDCGDYATWVDGMGCVHDEEIIVTPEEGWIDDPFFDPESLDEEDDSGGFYPPQPEDTECHVFYGCGGGVGPGPVPEGCPTGQVKDADGNCIDEEGDPEPCETNDEVIDHLGEVGTFQQLWEQSNTTLDIEDRTERGGWIIETSQGLQFQAFHEEGENWEYTACGINPPDSFIVPENSIGWIHTHPFYPGEDTTPVCGEEGEEEYEPGLSEDDYWSMMTIIEATNNFSFTSYMIDGAGISTMGLLGLSSTQSFEPCGYNP